MFSFQNAQTADAWLGMWNDLRFDSRMSIFNYKWVINMNSAGYDASTAEQINYVAPLIEINDASIQCVRMGASDGMWRDAPSLVHCNMY
jgi:hypothetical protein